jgi:hypothetical protein
MLLVLVVVVVVGSDIRSTHPPSVFNIFGVCIILFIQTETQKKRKFSSSSFFSLKRFPCRVGGGNNNNLKKKTSNSRGSRLDYFNHRQQSARSRRK